MSPWMDVETSVRILGATEEGLSESVEALVENAAREITANGIAGMCHCGRLHLPDYISRDFRLHCWVWHSGFPDDDQAVFATIGDWEEDNGP